jgi:hypothetical protein
LLSVNFFSFIYLVLFDFWCPICLRNHKWRLEAKKILGEATHPENAGDFVSLITVEFIGASPIDFLFGRGWKVTAVLLFIFFRIGI